MVRGVSPAVPVGLRCSFDVPAVVVAAEVVSPAVPVGLRCSYATTAEAVAAVNVSPAVPVGLRCSHAHCAAVTRPTMPVHRPSRSVSVAAGGGRPWTGPARSFHRPSRSVSVAAVWTVPHEQGLQHVSPAVPVGLRCSDPNAAYAPTGVTVSPAVPVGLRCSPQQAPPADALSAAVSPAVPVGLRCSLLGDPNVGTTHVCFTGRPGRSPLQPR